MIIFILLSFFYHPIVFFDNAKVDHLLIIHNYSNAKIESFIVSIL
jgi:hypothetical protein